MEQGAKMYLRYLAGDEPAFEEIVIMYSHNLTYFLTRYVPSFEDAEDIMIETFSILAEKKKRLDDDSKFKTYIFSIAKHLALNYIRKNKNCKTVSLDDVKEFEAKEETEKSVIKNENQRELLSALKKLPQDYSEVLYLCYFEQLNINEVSKIARKSVKQIYNLLNRAKIKLREVLTTEVSL